MDKGLCSKTVLWCVLTKLQPGYDWRTSNRMRPRDKKCHIQFTDAQYTSLMIIFSVHLGIAANLFPLSYFYDILDSSICHFKYYYILVFLMTINIRGVLRLICNLIPGRAEFTMQSYQSNSPTVSDVGSSGNIFWFKNPWFSSLLWCLKWLELRSSGASLYISCKWVDFIRFNLPCLSFQKISECS